MSNPDRFDDVRSSVPDGDFHIRIFSCEDPEHLVCKRRSNQGYAFKIQSHDPGFRHSSQEFFGLRSCDEPFVLKLEIFD